MRAIVAVEHAMVIAAFNMLVNGDFYRDPGADYYTARQPARTRARAISQLETLGYRVTLEPLTNTA
jgi:transposase